VEPLIKAHCLPHFLVNPSIPMNLYTIDGCENRGISEEYLKWEQQKQLLLSWLQSTISSEILTQAIGCKHLWQLWGKIHVYFHAHTNIKARRLRSQLRRSTLEICSASELKF